MLKIQTLTKSTMFLCLPALFAACTAKEPQVSKMSLSIPSVLSKSSNSAQSDNLQLAHLVLNVSAGDMKDRILYIWDRCHDCTNPPAPPSSFNVEVPSGRGRLVQVLAVYGDSSGLMNFYYGDKNADLTKTNESVQIPVADLTGGLPMISGALAGRYLDTADSGPTGAVEIRYQPPGQRPALVLKEGMIANGWFSFFALKGIPLRYIVKDTGRDIFGQALDLGDRTLLKPSVKVMKVFIPVHSFKDENNNLKNNNEAETHVMGFFGPGSQIAGAGKAVCHDVSGVAMPGRYLYGSDISALIFEEMTLEQSEPTNLYSRGPIRIQGGLTKSAALCESLALSDANTNAALYSQLFSFLVGNLQNDRSQVAGFGLPFAKILPPEVDAEPSTFGYHYDPSARLLHVSNGKISGRLLPGLNNWITGLRFYRVSADTVRSFRDMEHAPCSRITGPGDEFGSEHAGATTGIAGNGGFQVATSYSPSDAAANKGLAICFDTAKGPLSVGVAMESYQIMSYGNGGGEISGPSAPYLTLEGLYEYANGVKPLTKGKCYQVSLKTYKMEGGAAVDYNLLNDLQLDLNSTGIRAYASSYNCQHGYSSLPKVTINQGSSSYPETGSLWLRVEPSSSQTTESFEISSSAGVNSEVNIPSALNFNVGNYTLRMTTPGVTNFTVNTCHAINLSAEEADGNIASSFAAMNLSFVIPASGKLHMDSGCTGSSPIPSPLPISGSTAIYYKDTVTQSSANINFNDPGLSNWHFYGFIINIE